MAHAPLEPVTRRKLADEVLDRIWRMIESGEAAPGSSLPSERELMERFGVGRPAVREALQSLETLGVVTISHGERARVVSPTPSGLFGQLERSVHHLMTASPRMVEQLREARLMFECAMVRIAATRATAQQIETLREILQQQRAARRRGEQFLAADIRFHENLAHTSGNEILAALSAAMLGWLARHHRELLRKPGAEEATLQDHSRILEAVAAHQPEAAAQAMADHLNRANPLYRSARRKSDE